ncbi:MAG: acyl carrier protein [Candidatus Falkowbacteria bacterium]
MEKTAIEQIVVEIVAEQLDMSKEDVVLEASFSDDLGADSLDQVELIMAFEEKFDFIVSDEDAEKIETVQNAIDYISSHMGQES